MLLEGPSSSPTNPSSSSSIHATIYSSFSQAMLPSHHAYTDDDEGHKDKDEDSEGRTIKSNTEAGRKRKTDTDYSATTNHNNINTIVGPIITGGHRPQSTVPTSAFMKRILLHEACFHQHSRRCPNMIKFSILHRRSRKGWRMVRHCVHRIHEDRSACCMALVTVLFP